MKKILFAMIALFATMFVSCNKAATTKATSNDTTKVDTVDSVVVDSVDSVVVDSVK